MGLEVTEYEALLVQCLNNHQDYDFYNRFTLEQFEIIYRHLYTSAEYVPATKERFMYMFVLYATLIRNGIRLTSLSKDELSKLDSRQINFVYYALFNSYRKNLTSDEVAAAISNHFNRLTFYEFVK